MAAKLAARRWEADTKSKRPPVVAHWRAYPASIEEAIESTEASVVYDPCVLRREYVRGKDQNGMPSRLFDHDSSSSDSDSQSLLEESQSQPQPNVSAQHANANSACPDASHAHGLQSRVARAAASRPTLSATAESAFAAKSVDTTKSS